MTGYRYELSNAIPVAALMPLFAQTGWAANRLPAAVQAMLDKTLVCLGVWDGEKLIGFGRAVTDDVFRAVIEDVIVDEAYRGQGVGGELVRQLLQRLIHVEEIALVCEDHNIAFYEKYGFERFTMTHMHIWKGG